MKDNPARLRVVGGIDASPEAAPARPPMKNQMVFHHCAKCSEELGYEYAQMVQVLRDAIEANGKLIDGSLWWACARCLKPFYLIRMLARGPKK